jgi:hypothetical protein
MRELGTAVSGLLRSGTGSLMIGLDAQIDFSHHCIDFLICLPARLPRLPGDGLREFFPSCLYDLRKSPCDLDPFRECLISPVWKSIRPGAESSFHLKGRGMSGTENHLSGRRIY